MDSFFLNRAVFSIVTWQPIFCETDEFVMRKSGGFMGFETAVLYRKYGLRELELHRYELVFPESITPLDSLGAIIIYDYTYYNHIDEIKKYAEQKGIEYCDFN